MELREVEIDRVKRMIKIWIKKKEKGNREMVVVVVVVG